MDLTTISTALSSLQTAKDLLKTINDSKDLFEKSEIKLKLADLNDALANTKNQISDIKIELIEKNEIIKELEKKLNQKENLFFEKPYYLIKKDENEGPYCQICYDDKGKLIRLHDSHTLGKWKCPICNNYFFDKNYDHEKASKELSNSINRLSSFL
jgi:hypothetical protein